MRANVCVKWALSVWMFCCAQIVVGQTSSSTASAPATTTGTTPTSQQPSCAKDAPTSGTTAAAPTLNITTDAGNMTRYSGTAPNATSGTIRICVNDVPNGETRTVGSDGTFSSGTASFQSNVGDKIVAQSVIASGSSPTYGPVSSEMVVKSPAVLIMIGGVEYSGYSAQSQTTNGFLNMFYRGPVSQHGFSGWGRIRLTSAPQEATNGVVSVISNPTGLTTYNYSNVGQVFDYVCGPEKAIGKSKNWSIVAGIGATTHFRHRMPRWRLSHQRQEPSSARSW